MPLKKSWRSTPRTRTKPPTAEKLELIDEGRGEREVRVEQLMDEVAFRKQMGPRIYAFEQTAERLVKRDVVGADAYIFLLVLSSVDAPFRSARKAHEVEAAYDAIALEALRRYLGRGARAIRFAKNAHDPNDNESRPKKFRAAIKWLREELTLGPGIATPPDLELEAHWEDQDEDEPEVGPRVLNSYNDGGVDVVAWWRFADGRAGSPVLLAQCTVQLEWGEKVDDVPVELWKKWIDFETVPPQTALVIPFAVDRTSEQWANRTVQAGVIVDRVRLIELLEELDDADLASTVDATTKAWVDNQLNELAA